MLDQKRVGELFRAHPMLKAGSHEPEDILRYAASIRELSWELVGESRVKNSQDPWIPASECNTPRGLALPALIAIPDDPECGAKADDTTWPGYFGVTL